MTIAQTAAGSYPSSAAEATVVSEEKWNRASKSGSVKIEPSGVPVDIRCTAKFADDAQGCVITYAFDVSARVPRLTLRPSPPAIASPASRL